MISSKCQPQDSKFERTAGKPVSYLEKDDSPDSCDTFLSYLNFVSKFGPTFVIYVFSLSTGSFRLGESYIYEAFSLFEDHFHYIRHLHYTIN